MLSAAAARPGLGDFGWALLALMTAPDLVAGTRERNLRGDRCQRVNGPIRETTEVGISCGFHAGNPEGRCCGAPRQGGYPIAGLRTAEPAPHTGLDFQAVPSDISVMTETTDKKKLPAVVERFILHWGDMGEEWGVNRSVSQIHGLLYLAEEPMTAEDIADTLGMARSNVSNSIKELLSWNLIRRVPILGDRRDHFEAETDIWEVAARIAATRKEREIDPAVDALRACVSDAADDPTISPVASKRLKEMLAFTELVDRWYSQMLNVPRPRLIALIRLGEKIVSFLPGKSK